MFQTSGLKLFRATLKSRSIQPLLRCSQHQNVLIHQQLTHFATKNAKVAKIDDKVEKISKKKTKPKKQTASLYQKEAQPIVEAAQPINPDKIEVNKPAGQKEASTQIKQEFKLYTLKFNSPILPFSKFPLTQNTYIQEFLKKYEGEQDKIQKVIGVHFPNNSNANANGTVGIEIEIIKKNNITVVESNTNKRYKVNSYDELTNFCIGEEYVDEQLMGQQTVNNISDPKFKDLLMSEIYELKNLWYVYNKKISSMLGILPQEMLNRYELVTKTLQPPQFDIAMYSDSANFFDVFNEIVYKLSQHYFSVFQSIFAKDSDGVRPSIQDFLTLNDPILRSRKIIFYFEELNNLIDRKLYYVQKMAEEFKERSKTSLLEHAYKRVLEENKQSDKDKYQQKLDAIKGMAESTRKVIQEEINLLEQKNDMDNAKKISYLNHVFRMPWDQRVKPFWDVQHSKNVIEQTHYGMKETKERILEFIAKNKRINSQSGMVLLLTGPPGVGKTSIAKSIGECLKRPTTVLSMGGQNDPVHVKGSKRTYVDSQPGIFVKELQRLECKNPVIVIDEIDKIGFNSMRGDVSATLLELLNQEQSNTFRDNYLDIEFDFSECIFICTSNSTAHMLQPLLDRIEIIQVPAYLPIEKIKIAQNYLIPKFEKEYEFIEQNMELLKITDAALVKIINNYCSHEAGVRTLRKCLDRIFRKVVSKLEDKKIIEQDALNKEHSEEAASFNISPIQKIKEYQVNTSNVEQFLDIPPTDDHYYNGVNKQLPIGCSNGLAYVDDGQGQLLKIQFVKKHYGWMTDSKKEEGKETVYTPNNNNGKLTHTGRLGDVMKESVEVVKIAVFNFLIQNNLALDFDKDNYHLHVPMGATPKDGPSAGLSLYAALHSNDW